MDSASRPRVTVLAGFSPAAVAAVARSLLVTDPFLVMLNHDLTDVRAGVVRRTVRTSDGIVEHGHTELVHGCVSCTLREDVIPTLIRLGRERPDSDILLALPPAIEPEAVAAACTAAAVDVRFDSYVTVVAAATFLDDLATSDDLRDRGLHCAANDYRSVADVVSRQVEFADTVVLWDNPGVEPFERGRVISLLHRLAPWATLVRAGESPAIDCTALAGQLLNSGRHDPAVPGMLGRALEGYPIGIQDAAGEHGVNAMLFRTRRPFHPQRLHDALEELTGEALRGRGLLWFASQPDTAVGWESAGGGILLGNLGHWLAALPRDRWDEASDMRRLAADAAWDPYYGDRQTVLSFVGIGLDIPAVTAQLQACLLTDDELATGTDAWRLLPDPFADFFELEDDREAVS